MNTCHLNGQYRCKLKNFIHVKQGPFFLQLQSLTYLIYIKKNPTFFKMYRRYSKIILYIIKITNFSEFYLLKHSISLQLQLKKIMKQFIFRPYLIVLTLRSGPTSNFNLRKFCTDVIDQVFYGQNDKLCNSISFLYYKIHTSYNMVIINKRMK